MLKNDLGRCFVEVRVVAWALGMEDARRASSLARADGEQLQGPLKQESDHGCCLSTQPDTPSMLLVIKQKPFDSVSGPERAITVSPNIL